MPNPTGKTTRDLDGLQVFAQAFYDHGCNVMAAAREMGIPRQTGQAWKRYCIEEGFIKESDVSLGGIDRKDYLSARDRKIAEYQKKQRKGTWRKHVGIKLPERPFRLKLFGDPHLDSSGADFELFERHWLDMEPGRTYGICVGDWFNNWRQSLSHLWRGEGDPSDAWTCLEYLMEQRGEALLAACSGNHDDWTHAPVDQVDHLMKRHGVVYRIGAVRPLLMFDKAEPISVAVRHKWRGASIYSAAHGIRRAVEKGWWDDIAVGGHIHQDEPRMYTHPDTGEHSYICQLSSFKKYDDYVDVHGFMGAQISPVWDLVIDPSRPRTDPDRIKVFWDSGVAEKYLRAIE